MTVETGQRESLMAKLFKLWTYICVMIFEGKRSLTEVIDHLQEIKDDPNFRKKSVVAGSDAKSQLRSWRKFYQKYFGIQLVINEIKVPAGKEGFGWLIVLAKGLSNEKIFAKLAENFTCWKYADDLDKITSVRVNTATYAIWVRDRVEADEELKNQSADDLEAGNVNCITLPERMVLELYYWANHNHEHLDVQNITRCAGSRRSGGRVPCVYWDDGRLKVSWYCSSDRDDDLRSRQAVS